MQTIFHFKTNFQILKENSAFHPRWNSILRHSKFFIDLFECHIFLDVEDDFAFHLRIYLLAFLSQQTSFSIKFFERCSLENKVQTFHLNHAR